MGTRLSLRGACRGVSSRARLHPRAGTFPWHLDSGLEAGLVKALAGTRTQGRGYSRPTWAPPPTCCSSIPCPRRGRGGSSRPAPFLDARHLPRTPAMPPQGFGASHFSWVAFVPRPRSPWALWSGRGLRGPDCTLSHPTLGCRSNNRSVGRPAGDPVNSDPRPGCATPPGHLHAPR